MAGTHLLRGGPNDRSNILRFLYGMHNTGVDVDLRDVLSSDGQRCVGLMHGAGHGKLGQGCRIRNRLIGVDFGELLLGESQAGLRRREHCVRDELHCIVHGIQDAGAAWDETSGADGLECGRHCQEGSAAVVCILLPAAEVDVARVPALDC